MSYRCSKASVIIITRKNKRKLFKYEELVGEDTDHGSKTFKVFLKFSLIPG